MTGLAEAEVGVVSPGATLSFDDYADRWAVRDADGRTSHPRIVVGPAHVVSAATGGLMAYHGVAVAGLPNCFLLEQNSTERQARAVERCLGYLTAAGATRIEVRAGSQREFDRISRTRKGKRLRMRSGDFDLSNLEEREPDTEYSGAALLAAGDRQEVVTVDLSGHFEPLDGICHWYGRVAGEVAPFKKPSGAPLFVTIDGGAETPASLAEQDPWGNFRITGVGTPPWSAPCA